MLLHEFLTSSSYGEERGSRFLRNIGTYLPDYTSSCLGDQQYSSIIAFRKLNASVLWFAFRVPIWQVLCSNLGPDTGHPDRFLVDLLVTAVKFTSNSVMTASFLVLSHSLFIYRRTVRCHEVEASDSVIK
jgi:hypothetical protein